MHTLSKHVFPRSATLDQLFCLDLLSLYLGDLRWGLEDGFVYLSISYGRILILCYMLYCIMDMRLSFIFLDETLLSCICPPCVVNKLPLILMNNKELLFFS